MTRRVKQTSAVDGIAGEIGMANPIDLPEREVFLNLARTYSVLSDQVHALIKQHGLSAPQYNALRILRGHGKPVSIYQIGEQMVTRQPDMPRLIERLEKQGFASRERCETDRRVVWVSLTKKGKSVLKQIDAPLDELHRDQLQHLSEKQMKTLSQLLVKARRPEG